MSAPRPTLTPMDNDSQSGWTFPSGDIVRRLRRALDMSQRELAKAAQVGRATVTRIESGQLEPRVGQLQRLLDLVGWSLVVIDFEGRYVVPLKEYEGELRDGADRRFPAHLDVILEPRWGEWWGDAFGLARPPETYTRDRRLRDQRRAASQRDLFRGPYRRRRRR